VNYLLDTNVLSELRKGKRANVGLIAWMTEAADDDLYLSVLVIGELRQGVERIRRRDAASAAGLERWLAGLIEAHGERILPIDVRICELWGRLNVPNPLPAVDGLLAATALVHDLVLVTRNTRDVARAGVRTVNPFA
jgi:toxin FitB